MLPGSLSGMGAGDACKRMCLKELLLELLEVGRRVLMPDDWEFLSKRYRRSPLSGATAVS